MIPQPGYAMSFSFSDVPHEENNKREIRNKDLEIVDIDKENK
jgi:hypothetical protein